MVPDGEETGLGEQMLTFSFQEEKTAQPPGTTQPKMPHANQGIFFPKTQRARGGCGSRAQRCVLCAPQRSPAGLARRRGWDRLWCFQGGKPAIMERRERCQQTSGNLYAETASQRKVFVHLIFLLWVVPSLLSLAGFYNSADCETALFFSGRGKRPICEALGIIFSLQWRTF